MSGFDRATIGEQVSVSKTVSETDVYLFAGLTGDLADLHVNDAVMSTSHYGQRIAHGALTVGLMSTASTKMIERVGGHAVSYGYDRIRFVRPVFFGDTITVVYEIADRREAKQQSVSRIEARNQRDEVVAVAEHVLQFFDSAPAVGARPTVTP